MSGPGSPQLPYKARVKAKRRTGSRNDETVSRPWVVWRRLSCRHELLAVYLTPDGWQVVPHDFEVPAPDWVERIGGEQELLDQHRRGEVFLANIRKVRAQSATLPHAVDDWPALHLSIEVGCIDSTYVRSRSYLAEQIRRVIATREPIVDKDFS
jgi:hypothetical protein